MATKKLYRSRDGKIFGICQGLADWKDLPVKPLRLIVAISIIATSVFPGVLIYALMALIIPLEPSYSKRYSSDQESMRSWYENLKRKVENMEDQIFDKEADWDQRFNDKQNKF